jgi:hypothetical protein
VERLLETLLALAAHPSAAHVRFVDAPLDTPAAMNAVVDLGLNRAGANFAACAAALGALVAANAPALEEINLTYCYLGDAGLGPLVDALPHNTHLRTLNCQYNGISAAFARRRLLPAVRANTSLRKLLLIRPRAAEDESSDDDSDREDERDAARLLMTQMERMVAAREGAAAAQA